MIGGRRVPSDPPLRSSRTPRSSTLVGRKRSDGRSWPRSGELGPRMPERLVPAAIWRHLHRLGREFRVRRRHCRDARRRFGSRRRHDAITGRASVASARRRLARAPLVRRAGAARRSSATTRRRVARTRYRQPVQAGARGGQPALRQLEMVLHQDTRGSSRDVLADDGRTPNIQASPRTLLSAPSPP